jgi:hypothetical protein
VKRGSLFLIGLFVAGALLFLGSHLSANAHAETAPSAHTSELTAMIEFEREAMTYWLRVASDDPPPCTEPCLRDTSFTNIVNGLIARCEKIEPDGLAADPGYSPSLHQRTTEELATACNVLQSAKASHGEPKEAAEWVKATQEALSGLQQRGG